MMRAADVLGLIPARGGSKGVPRKNLRLVAGLPLVAHTIQAARSARSIDRVIVSTDDEEIAAVARSAGAELPFLRPPRYASDTAPSISVIHHALEWLAEHEEYRPEVVALLAPTTPLRDAMAIDGTLALLRANDVDSAATVRPIVDHPYFVYSREADGRLSELIELPDKPLRRQELPAYYALSQAVLASRCVYLRSAGEGASVVNPRSVVGYEIDERSAIDIDTEDDLARIISLMGGAPR